MGSESYHEPMELIDEPTREMHRAIVSLIEEFEAIDWYAQRAGACSSEDLRAVLLHHREEEIEHAMMNLEWIRRHDPQVDANARLYLFTEAPIVEVEAQSQAAAERTKKASGPVPTRFGCLGLGSLKEAK